MKIFDCPFCGAEIPDGQWTMTNGFQEVVCSCGARAPLRRWNTRRYRKNGLLVGHTGQPITSEDVARLQDDP